MFDLAPTKRVICDAEFDGLNPRRVWVIVCKDIDTGEVNVFRKPDENPSEFLEYTSGVSVWVGHNFLAFDLLHLHRLIPSLRIDPSSVIDTLVVSRLLHQRRRGGHSLARYGSEFNRPKPEVEEEDWGAFSELLVHRCTEDVHINHLVYKKYEQFITSPVWAAALRLEHDMVVICNHMTANGFFFSLKKAKELKEIINNNLLSLEEELKKGFPQELKFLRLCSPKETKFKTISLSSIPKKLRDAENGNLSDYSVGADFSYCEWVEFDPASTTQRIERLWKAGWQPRNKTKKHKEADKEARELRRRRKPIPEGLQKRLDRFAVYGWTIDEENLLTLPDTAPEAAQKLVEWLMVSNRRSTLETWINACRVNSGRLEGIPAGEEDGYGRIHGSFNPLGAWTHRMSHADPNAGNIPKFDSKQPRKTPYSDRMRELWSCTPGRYLVGVDAESIQLRVLAHYLNDEEFTNALIRGRKEDGSDPHSVNQRALGSVCKSRDDAKTFIYAWLLGAGVEKVAAILGCSRDEASEAVENFIRRYTGLQYLKEEIIPRDASRGYFEGLDGRYVRIKGSDIGAREHFTLAGYLQNGEVIIMKRANRRWTREVSAAGVPYWQVNFVHDEFQTETRRIWDEALFVANTQADSIRIAGEELGLRCPTAGSILNSHGKIAIGNNWMETH